MMENLCVLTWDQITQNYAALELAFSEDPEPLLIGNAEQPALALMSIETFSIFNAALDFLINRDLAPDFENWLDDSPQSLRIDSFVNNLNN